MQTLISLYTFLFYPFVCVVMAMRMKVWHRRVALWYGAAVGGLISLPIVRAALSVAANFGLNTESAGQPLVQTIAVGWGVLVGAAQAGVAFPGDDLGGGMFRFNSVAILAAFGSSCVMAFFVGVRSLAWYSTVLLIVVATLTGGFVAALVGDGLSRTVRRLAGLAEGEFEGIEGLDDPLVRGPLTSTPITVRTSLWRLMVFTIPIFVLALPTWPSSRFVAVTVAAAWVIWKYCTTPALEISSVGVRSGKNAVWWKEVNLCVLDDSRYRLHFLSSADNRTTLSWVWLYASNGAQQRISALLYTFLQKERVRLLPAPIPSRTYIIAELRKVEADIAAGRQNDVAALLRSTRALAQLLKLGSLVAQAQLLEAKIAFSAGAISDAFDLVRAASASVESVGDQELLVECFVQRSRMLLTVAPIPLRALASIRRDARRQNLTNSPKVLLLLAEFRAASSVASRKHERAYRRICQCFDTAQSQEEAIIWRRARADWQLAKLDRQFDEVGEVWGDLEREYAQLAKEADFALDRIAQAWCVCRSGNYEAGVSLLEKERERARTVGDLRSEAVALWRIALAHLRQRDWETGYSSLRAACDRVESFRAGTREDSERIGVVVDHRERICSEMVSLCLAMPAEISQALAISGPQKALEYAERLKSRALLDLVTGRIRLGPAVQTTAISQGSSMRVPAVHPLNFPELRTSLPKDAALVEYYEVKDKWSVFVLTAKHFDVIPLAVTGPHPDIVTMIRQFVRLLREVRPLSEIRSEGQRLYDILWTPLIEHLRDIRMVYVVPHGPLHDLPFGALYNGGSWQLESAPAVCYVPSGSIMARLQGGTARHSSRFVGMANPGIPLLRTVVDEVSSCAMLYRDPVVLPRNGVSPWPSKDEFIRYAAAADVVHLACHGRLAADPLECGFQLWSDDRPQWFTVRDILSRPLHIHLLVASLCHGGAGQLASGDEWLGLLRAFFAAGVRCVVAPRWEMADDAGALIMKRFHECLTENPGREVAVALRSASISLAKESVFTHPFFWSSLGVWGSGGPLYTNV